MAWAYNTPDGTLNNGPAIVAVAIAVTMLAFIALSLRLYVRTMIVKAMGLDDWIIIVSWMGCFGYAVSTIIQTRWGLGLVLLDDMPNQNILNFGLVQYIGSPFYVVGIWGFKISLLVSYIRLVPGSYRVVPITVAIIVTMAHIAFVFVFLLQCSPVAKVWQPDIPGQCIAEVPFFLTFSSITIVFDVITLMLPFPVLVKLQMKLRKKIVLLSLFALGLFVTIVQIIRIQTITNLTNYLDSAEAIKWSIVENAVGIIIACVPTLAPLVKYFSARTRSGTNSASARQGDAPYALQSWRTGKSGMRTLASGADKDSDKTSVSKPADESTDNILGENEEAARGPGAVAQSHGAPSIETTE